MYRNLSSSFGVALLLVSTASAQYRSAPAYPLAGPPLEILDRLTASGLGDMKPMSPPERAMLESAWKKRGKLSESELVEALTFASGVDDEARRKQYRDRFDRLAAKAKDVVSSAKSPYARGETVTKFVHGDVMKKGYSLDQTLWTDVFDSGRYNCVSSTAMVYLVGSHVGLELRPISIPGDIVTAGHATLDMLDAGKRIEVEATNPDGFDWRKKMSRPGVVVLGFVPDRKSGYEVGPAGIAAMIYSNRAVALQKSKNSDPLLEARLLLSALALEPADGTAGKNLLGVLGNWGPALAKAGKHEEAVRVAAFAVSIAPKDSGLRNNARFAWKKYSEHLLAAGKDAEAVAVVKRAAAAMPEERDFRGGAETFESFGESQRKKLGWEATIKIADRGLAVVSGDEAKKLIEWRSSLQRRWSQSLIEAGDFDGSLDVLAKASAATKGDRAIEDGIGYHVQTALEKLSDKKGLEAALAHHQTATRKLAGVKRVDDAAWNFAIRRVVALADKNDFDGALAVADALEPLVHEKKQELVSETYARWSRSLARAQKHEEALAKIKQGLERQPGDDRLKNAAEATIDDWARTPMRTKNWDEAIRIYRRGLEAFPGDGHLRQNLEYCVAQKGRS